MAPPPPCVSLRDYLAGEEISELRHQYLDGEVFEMEAATIDHQAIVAVVLWRIAKQLEGKPCTVLPSPRTATAANGLYTYPDLVIVCGPIETWPTDRNTIANPRVILEVLSPTTEGYDRGKKFDAYRRLPSFVEYICVAQDSAWILHQQRQDDGTWLLRYVTGLDATLQLTSVPVQVPLAEIYRDVDLEVPL